MRAILHRCIGNTVLFVRDRPGRLGYYSYRFRRRLLGLIMRRLTIIVASLLAVCACTKNDPRLPEFGKTVQFSTNGESKANGTKAYYPGLDSTEHSGKIFWENGDVVRIYCAQSSSPSSHIADYVSGASDPQTGYTKLTSEPGLAWGTGSHIFYAVYPSPLTEGKSGDSLAPDQGSECSLLGHIPASQSISAKGSATIAEVSGYYTQPDMTHLYMVSKTEATPTAEAVDLSFKSIVTAIRFVIKNTGEDNWLALYEASLTSPSSSLCGDFKADLGNWDPSQSSYPGCTSEQTGDKTVTVSLGKDGLSVAPGGVIAITFILPPTQDFNDLTLTLTIEDGAKITKELKSSKTGQWFTFAQNKLSYATMSVDGTSTDVNFIGSIDNYLISDALSREIAAALLAHLIMNVPLSELVALLETLGLSEADAYVVISTIQTLELSDLGIGPISILLYSLLVDDFDNAAAILDDLGLSPDILLPVADALANLDISRLIENSAESILNYEIINVSNN